MLGVGVGVRKTKGQELKHLKLSLNANDLKYLNTDWRCHLITGQHKVVRWLNSQEKVQQKQRPLSEGRKAWNSLADDNRMVNPQANKGLGRDASSWLGDQSPALYLFTHDSKGRGLSLGPWMWTDAAAITIIPTTVNTSPAFAVGTTPDDHSSSSQCTQDVVRDWPPSTVSSVC